MCSASLPSSSLLFTTDGSIFLRRRCEPPFLSFLNSFASKSQKSFRLSAYADDRNSSDRSWLGPLPHSVNDCYRGWLVVGTPGDHPRKTKGVTSIAFGAVVGSSIVLLATLAYISVSRKGFTFQLPTALHSLLCLWGCNEADNVETKDLGVADHESKLFEASQNQISYISKRHASESVIVPVDADSTQLEALSMLKTLKIIGDVRADELCTRRNYARWLVYLNSLLERNPKYRIIPSVALAGSVSAAFDDISSEDPDFEPIQALAEAGIISSKLSEEQYVNFYPERFVSRQELVNWKAQTEYEFVAPNTDRISKTKADYMDMNGINFNVVPGLFTDILAGEKSIIRTVFGQMKRFQPNRPSTVAQAAVALTCGRMGEAIFAELSRIELENSCQKAEKEVIKSELLGKEDVERCWEEKLNNEQVRLLELEERHLFAAGELEREKMIQKEWFDEHLKKKSTVNCHKQLLVHLKEDVDGMIKRLESEKEMQTSEQVGTHYALSDALSKVESLKEKRSVLEAEIEAIRIYRSWVEDEGKKSESKVKVLEDVRRRWKWEDSA